MGVAASSFRRPKDGAAGGAGFGEGDLWVTLKAKTTCKRTRAIKKKKMTFQPTEAGISIGSGEESDFSLEDSNLQALHASVVQRADGSIVLETLGRTYFLIGQGVKSTGPHKLEKDQVVKMGACSLQVTDTCTSDMGADADALTRCAHDDGEEVPVCYICFDDSSEPDNPLCPSPCACAKPVHKQCLSRWIATKGSRVCSICKSKLPIRSTVSPPFLVLQVVRHMRGLHWSGEREYIISFSSEARKSVSIGSGGDCDLSLPDPSLSRVHSRIQFREEDAHFHVEDLTSSAGTFLKLTGPKALSTEQVAMFKMGRTMLTIKLERRRAGVLRSWRARKKNRGVAGEMGPEGLAEMGETQRSLAGLLSPTSIATGVGAPSQLSVMSPPDPFSPTSLGPDSPVVSVRDNESPMHAAPGAPTSGEGMGAEEELVGFTTPTAAAHAGDEDDGINDLIGTLQTTGIRGLVSPEEEAGVVSPLSGGVFSPLSEDPQ